MPILTETRNIYIPKRDDQIVVVPVNSPGSLLEHYLYEADGDIASAINEEMEHIASGYDGEGFFYHSLEVGHGLVTIKTVHALQGKGGYNRSIVHGKRGLPTAFSVYSFAQDPEGRILVGHMENATGVNKAGDLSYPAGMYQSTPYLKDCPDPLDIVTYPLAPPWWIAAIEMHEEAGVPLDYILQEQTNGNFQPVAVVGKNFEDRYRVSPGIQFKMRVEDPERFLTMLSHANAHMDGDAMKEMSFMPIDEILAHPTLTTDLRSHLEIFRTIQSLEG